MTARLYVIPLSNPAAAGAAMVAHKRIAHRLVCLPPGFHPPLVRAAGFPGWTVPALELDGRKAQGTLAIARLLDVLVPDPPLFPREPAARARAEAAERWGHDELQPLPRRLFRWALLRDPALRRWFAAEVLGLPAPALVAALGRPIVGRLATVSGAADDGAAVRADLRRLPELLDRVDALIADGTIAGAEPGAADFQVFASVRALLELEDLAGLVRGRACEALARRLYPSWTGPVPHSEVLVS